MTTTTTTTTMSWFAPSFKSELYAVDILSHNDPMSASFGGLIFDIVSSVTDLDKFSTADRCYVWWRSDRSFLRLHVGFSDKTICFDKTLCNVKPKHGNFAKGGGGDLHRSESGFFCLKDLQNAVDLLNAQKDDDNDKFLMSFGSQSICLASKDAYARLPTKGSPGDDTVQEQHLELATNAKSTLTVEFQYRKLRQVLKALDLTENSFVRFIVADSQSLWIAQQRDETSEPQCAARIHGSIACGETEEWLAKSRDVRDVFKAFSHVRAWLSNKSPMRISRIENCDWLVRIAHCNVKAYVRVTCLDKNVK